MTNSNVSWKAKSFMNLISARSSFQCEGRKANEHNNNLSDSSMASKRALGQTKRRKTNENREANNCGALESAKTVTEFH